MRKCFKLFFDSLDVLDELTDEQAGQLFKAIRAYELDGTDELTGILRAVFTPFKNNSDRAKDAYMSVVKANRENGLKGGRPKSQKNRMGFYETEQKPKNPKKDKDKDKDINIIKEIVDDLNLVCGTKFKTSTTMTASYISARLSEGYTIDDFKRVHRVKYEEWAGTEYSKYLNPSTLYRPTNFEKYLNQFHDCDCGQVGGITW